MHTTGLLERLKYLNRAANPERSQESRLAWGPEDFETRYRLDSPGRSVEFFAALLLAAATAGAQSNSPVDSTKPSRPDSAAPAPVSKPSLSFAPIIEIQHLRANDKRGINVFEMPKNDGVPYDGFKLNFGGAFTQQFQGLGHSNSAAPKVTNNVNANQLMEIGHGFNNASANLYINAQLAPGIRVAMTSTASAIMASSSPCESHAS